MKVALVLYPGFTALDVVGPFQVLAAAPGVETMLVAHELGPVADDTDRCPMIASATFPTSQPRRLWSFRAASSTSTSTRWSWTG
jgi:putative intracellular protease/amidase